MEVGKLEEKMKKKHAKQWRKVNQEVEKRKFKQILEERRRK